jgi:hypothetical protein
MLRAIQRAKQRFALPDTTPILSYRAAGRHGFWLHRYLDNEGVHDSVVGGASIEINRFENDAAAFDRKNTFSGSEYFRVIAALRDKCQSVS